MVEMNADTVKLFFLSQEQISIESNYASRIPYTKITVIIYSNDGGSNDECSSTDIGSFINFWLL